MSIQLLTRILLSIGLTVAIGSYLYGVTQSTSHPRAKRAVAYGQISLRYWRYLLSHVNVEDPDFC